MKCETPGAVVPLVAGADVDPEPERDRAHARHPLGDDPLARVELGQDDLLHGPMLSLGWRSVGGSDFSDTVGGVVRLGATEVSRHFSDVLNRVAAGEEIGIVRNGRR